MFQPLQQQQLTQLHEYWQDNSSQQSNGYLCVAASQASLPLFLFAFSKDSTTKAARAQVAAVLAAAAYHLGHTATVVAWHFALVPAAAANTVQQTLWEA